MTHLDDELRGVLQRKEPHAGFAERVARRAKARPPAAPLLELVSVRRGALRRRFRWDRFAAAAALIAAIGGAGVGYRVVQQERMEHAAGEAARAQLMYALEVAGTKLQHVQTKVHDIQNGRPTKPDQ